MLAVGAVAFGLLGVRPQHGSAAPVVVAGGTLTVCDSEMNGGGTGVRCTVSVTNNLNPDLTLAGGSSWTVTRCTGATGDLWPGLDPGAACVTTVTPTTGAPITRVLQCNFAGNGGGGGVRCSATIANHFAVVPPGGIVPATRVQCVGSGVGGGIPVRCLPTVGDNSIGVLEAAATVAQCNRSSINGGLRETDPAGIPNNHCVIGASTTTAALPVSINQCNDSSNGGGAFLQCSATVTNELLPVPEETVPVVVPIVVPPAATPPPVVVVVVPPTATPPAVVTVPPVIVLPPLVVAPGVTQVVAPPVVVPPGVTQVIVPVIAPPGIRPVPVPQVVPPALSQVRPPLPANTGNAGLAGTARSVAPAWPLGILALAVVLGGRMLVSRAKIR